MRTEKSLFFNKKKQIVHFFLEKLQKIKAKNQTCIDL